MSAKVETKQLVQFAAPLDFESPAPSTPEIAPIVAQPVVVEKTKITTEQVREVIRLCKLKGYKPGTLVLRVKKDDSLPPVTHWALGKIDYLNESAYMPSGDYAPINVRFFTGTQPVKCWPDELFVVAEYPEDSTLRASVTAWRKTIGDLPNANALGLA